MTQQELAYEFDRIDAKLMKSRRNDLFCNNLSFALGSMTLQEVIDYYQEDLRACGDEFPKTRSEYLMIIIQLLMIKIRRTHCNGRLE